MEIGALLFVTFLGVGGFAMLALRILQARGDAPTLPDLWADPPVNRFSAADDEIMSRTPDTEVSEGVSPRTDAVPDGRTELVAPALKPETVDGARSLREHGYSRDEARAFLKAHGYSLGNDTWAAAKPAPLTDDDLIVTPYAGRVTRKSYYPAEPELEYQEPKT